MSLANILGGIGTLVGGYFGGPWGGAAGGAIGSMLGGGSTRQDIGWGLGGGLAGLGMEAGGFGYGAGSEVGGGITGQLGAAGGYGLGLSESGSGLGLMGGEGTLFGGLSTGDLGAVGAGGAGVDVMSGGGGGGSFWDNLSTRHLLGYLGMGQGAVGYLQGMKLSGMAPQTDPYAAERATALARLQALQVDPSSITGTPGYEAGLQALERTEAAQGFTGGGKAATDIAGYGAAAYNAQIQALIAQANMGDPTAPARIAAMGYGLQGQGAEQMGIGSVLAFL